MRDTVKQAIYFENSLAFTNESINDFERIIPHILADQGDESRGAKSGYSALVLYYTTKVNLLYSLGEPVVAIRQVYENLLGYYVKVWSIYDGYIELIRMLSLGVLLELRDSDQHFKTLERRIEEANFNDYLVNYLIRHIDQSWKLEPEELSLKGIYEPLKDVVEASSKNLSEDLLRNYLEKQWYSIHDECAWYGSHKSQHDTYYGYWAFEAGAIAKILELNDRELKNQPYYPYDLVHFVT